MVFVITGGSRGLGRALALALSDRDESVVIVGRQEDTLAEVCSLSQNIEAFVADVSNASSRQSLVQYLQHKGPLKGLIHNAGLITPIVGLDKIQPQEWQQLMATNVEGPLFLSQQLLPQLTEGRVLHIGSGAAYFPVVGWSAYCTSKAALSMLTQCWQLECQAPAFASVMPGIVDTEMVNTIRHATHMAPEKLDFFRALKAQDRLLKPETVSLFLAWLLLDVDASTFQSKEWDIYDSQHHASWLPSHHTVPSIS